MMQESPVKPCQDRLNAKETILLVEDDDIIRFMSRTFLETTGYSVMEAPSGEEAAAIWEQNNTEIDLVVTDLVMPGGITGLELAQQLQTDRPDLKVIFTSGGERAETAFLGPAANFLPKPYRLNGLAQMIRQVLDVTERAAA